ncbi:MAG TPA: hypothetical protein VGZ73_10990 [Bryobacteraceae bacterium]|jgi:hypothetical protein|nr:hypothetical protein [Bryobacteraceae bacterium]
MNRHLSSEEISRWMIGEHTSEAQRHAIECPPCRAELDRLEAAFSLFRESGIRWSDRCYHQDSPPPSANLATLPGRRLLPWAFAVATSALVAALLLRPVPVPPKIAIQLPDRRSEEPFLEIPYVAPLAPYERTSLVRMDVPVAALIAAGFEVRAADTGASVRADVVFGQDGRAHAIRLVPDPIADSDRRLNQ